jgi:hypothetical protein
MKNLELGTANSPDSSSTELSQQARNLISKNLETLWARYVDAIHRFIALNTSLVVGLAGLVSFLPRLHGVEGKPTPFESKLFLIGGLVLLMFSLIGLIVMRIWAQRFMEYEILPPQALVESYFKGRVPYTTSHLPNPRLFKWQVLFVRFLIWPTALCFLTGLGSSLIFLYRNLP